MRYRVSDGKKTATTTSSQAESQDRLSNSASCRRAASTTLRPSYGMGMWRVVALLACLSATQAALFTEGGAVQYGQENKANKNFELAQDEKPANKEYNEKYLKDDEENTQEERYKEYLEGILPILNDDEDKKAIDSMDEYNRFLQMVDQEEEPKTKMERNYYYTEPQFKIDPKLYYYTRTGEMVLKDPSKVDPIALDNLLRGEMMIENEIAQESELKKEAEATKEKLAKNTVAAKVNVESLESAMQTATGEPQVPQKKGQNEFVSFVEPEPQPAKQTISSQQIDKRRLATSAEYSGNSPRYSSSSLLLLAVGTVMCVGLIGTIAGGTYYYKNNRRTETPDDGEYAPYAGTGPGFRKTKGNKGDETLAYKAQLHQYQQAKQKIICGEDAPGIIESDGEDGADEENNYSVYECPGLAPTGDIEVCNPNFAAQP
ncbi:CRE-CAB-1 protein [Caenorhabditis remanei]|uniref:CRE-CAB-1 protein n=1 Tax=Caenorhabditis remanei TaxID=31234 RepID=E3MKF7_CAERE|nr:CRE-CAB-1 protein [Caenorhabditis remanei]